ncbi:MAG: lysine biosynthesis protein LysX [archaeon]
MKIGMLLSKLRKEEMLLFDEAKRKNVILENVNSDGLMFSLEKSLDYDIVLDRDVSFSRSLYASRFLESYGIKTVNSFDTIRICGDKALTSIALKENNVPTPKTIIAFSEESALNAIEEIGYPCVMKPVIGSWARLLAKVNDRNAAEALIEHKKTLGNYLHSIFYIQELIKKPDRDIRACVIGEETIYAIYRKSDHWITNTARGGKTENCMVDDELNEICIKAAKAVGSGILAIDVMESENGLLVHEVNHNMEFKNSILPTGVNIPEKIIEYLIAKGKR